MVLLQFQHHEFDPRLTTPTEMKASYKRLHNFFAMSDKFRQSFETAVSKRVDGVPSIVNMSAVCLPEQLQSLFIGKLSDRFSEPL